MKKEIKKLLLIVMLITTSFIINAQNLNNPNKSGPLGTQVNTFTGNLFIPRTDIYVPARGFDIDITFFYNSFLYDLDFGYGRGWSFQYDVRYSTDTSDNKVIFWGDGREDTYSLLSDGGYKAPKGFFSTLSQYETGKYLITETDGTKFYFDDPAHRRITKMEEPNGNYISFSYTDSLLTTLTNASGQTITLTYDAKGRLATVEDAIAAPARTFTYSYDGVGNLKEVMDPLGNKQRFTYLVNGPMKTITDKNSNTVDIIYFPDFSIRELIGCNKRMSFSYDTTYKISVVTDHLETGNQVTKYTYEKVDNLLWMTSISGNCCGFNMTYEFDDRGNQIKMIDANGNIYEYTYDDRGNMLTAKDPLGQQSTYTYSSDFNKITSFVDPKGNTYTLSYDAAGNLISLTAPGNIIYTASYNSTGDIVSSTDPKGNTFTYNYDTYGNPTNVTGPNGFNAALSFDARGNLLSFTDANGNTSGAEYDILNRLKKITDPINETLQYNYDAEGNLTSLINENNETSILNYDASNRIVKITGPTGSQMNLEYDGMDNITAIKNPLGDETKLTYNKLNRLIATKDALDNNASYSYDGNGNVTTVNLPNGRTVTYTYDKLNRVASVSDNSGTIAALTYDATGNIISYTNGTGAKTSANYDDLNRLVKLTDPLGNSYTYTYDKNDNVTTVTDRNGNTSSYTYDDRNRIKTSTDNNGFVINVSYDNEGNITELNDQNNNSKVYTYDEFHRVKKTTYPDGSFTEFGYDEEGNITSKRLTDGSTITFQYDPLNRITTKTLPDGQVFSYGYDAMGRVITATNNAGTINIAYDALGRITSETFDGRTTEYTYDIAGRNQTTTYPDGTVITKEFDTRNQLLSIKKNEEIIVSYAYNNEGQVTSKLFGNGISTNMQYDIANRLSSLSTGGGSIQNITYAYDNEGNKLEANRLNDPSLSEQFAYDNGYRLTGYKRGMPGSPSIEDIYTYDAVGNRTANTLNGVNTTYTVNNLNQLVSSNGAENILFSYDDNGNLTYDGKFHKFYDATNRLIKDSSLGLTINYEYDALGRRIQKNINGQIIKYTYNWLSQIEERDAAGLLVNRNIFENFLTPVLLEDDVNSFYYHQNELNSVEKITSGSGNIVESYRYDVYGSPSVYDASNSLISGSAINNRFAFTGQEWDSTTANYKFHFRNYSPQMGTFNQRDPIGYDDGMGMYQYVGNDPANGIDILGLKCNWESIKTSTKEFLKGVMQDAGNWGMQPTAFLSSAEALSGTSAVSKTGTIGQGMKTAGEIGKNNSKFLGKVGAVGAALDFGSKSINAYDVHNDPNSTYFNKVDANADLAGSTLGLGTSIAAITASGPAAPAVAAAVAITGLVDYGTERITYLTTGEEGWGIRKHTEKPIVNAGVSMQEAEDWRRVYDHYLYLKYKVGDERADLWMKLSREKYSKKRKKCPEGGTRKQRYKIDPATGKTTLIAPRDPNEIIGPEGQQEKKWINVKDRMAYTILFENHIEAGAPAKYVHISTPIEPKQDPATFELGHFGFNNLSFTIPPGQASYYERLDCRDSMNLYVDVVAGYDQMKNEAFWEFHSIDPVTLLPTEEPLAGFLFLQDSSNSQYGHGFVTFSIKPLASSVTLDTIGARADIVFDINDTIPTNIYTNTIDAFAPSSHMNTLAPAIANPVALSWGGADDTGGSGIRTYTLYVSHDGTTFNVFSTGMTSTDTSFYAAGNTMYHFFVQATDSVGNIEELKNAPEVSVHLPMENITFSGKIFLQGAYDPLSGLMSNGLNTGGILQNAATGQPYTAAPFNHSGNETVDAGFFAANPNIVDWVLIELRDATTPSDIYATRAAFVLRDGTLVDTNGTSNEIVFEGVAPTNYHVAIRHRNHLGIRTVAPLDFTLGSAEHDFTTDSEKSYQNQAYTSTVSMAGVWVMRGGNADQNSNIKYNGPFNDQNRILNNVLGGSISFVVNNVYAPEDVNMNGNVKWNGPGNDQNALLNTMLGGLLSAIFFEQL